MVMRRLGRAKLGCFKVQDEIAVCDPIRIMFGTAGSCWRSFEVVAAKISTVEV